MEFQLSQIALYLFLGAALGYVSGSLGIGGGLLTIPLLALGFGMDQQTAQGTALLLMAPNMVIGFWGYRKRNPITFRMAALLGSGSIVVSYISSIAAAEISTDILRTLVAIFMIGLAANLAWRSYGHVQVEKCRILAPQWLLTLVGGIGGFCSGFFTIGGGVVVIPILTGFFGFTQTAAQGLALAMLAPGTLVALATYAHLGLVDWMVSIPMAIGSILTVSHGVALAHRLPERKLRAAFSLVLFFSAVAMLLH